MVQIAYLKRVKTSRKSGKNFIYSKSLKSVLGEQSQKNPVSEETLNDEKKSRELKETEPGIFPVSLVASQTRYTDSVFNRQLVNGKVVFLDIDSVELAERMFYDADVLQNLFPPLLAVWYSLRGKMHIAVRCDWTGFSGYAAAWIGISAKLSDIVSRMYGKTTAKKFNTANDRCMIEPNHCISACYTKGYQWFGDGLVFAGEDVYVPDPEIVAQNKWRETPKDSAVKDTLFTDGEAKKKWHGKTINSWVNWAEKNRPWKYVTENKEPSYKSIYIEPGVNNSWEYVTLRYWENDGDYYTIRMERKGYKRRKLLDGRKRCISAVAKYAASVLTVSFEECLYITSKFWLRNCEPWDAYERIDAAALIQSKVEDAYANRVRNMNTINWLRDTREILIDPQAEENFCYNGRAQASMAAAVKAQLRINKLRECYSKGDTLTSLTDKMLQWYPNIKETTVYRLAKIADLKIKSTDKYRSIYGDRYKHKYDGRYQYVNAYDSTGRRTRVKKELVDGKNYFDSKKKYNEYVKYLDAEQAGSELPVIQMY